MSDDKIFAYPCDEMILESTFDNHPFSRDSKPNTIIQCVGYIALDVYGVVQKSFHKNFKYWVP